MDTQTIVRFVPNERLILRLHNFIEQDKTQYYEEIFGKFAAGKVITVGFGSCDSVKDVMEKIEDMEGIPCVLQKLMFCGKQLHNTYRKLVDYDIMGGSALELSLSIIFVKQLNGPLSLLQVGSSDRLGNVKVRVSREGGFDPGRMQITYPRDLRYDDLSLGEYGIHHFSTIEYKIGDEI
ncbi:uncharacterized protein LOC131857378 [Cryptomeria japonica]|uniref:uncharacterized protein LOC131857378 n=1 Tax=Cryptomeria japonica TaxID=3369 RepID=UPI0027DA69E1|nr:uncharacterized protein LOC131857378 [Cryptomeria japonica]